MLRDHILIHARPSLSPQLLFSSHVKLAMGIFGELFANCFPHEQFFRASGGRR